MLRGKTLSDNDAAARARNRQEEESLSVRLKHLDLQQELLHNNREKEKKTLLETRRTTRRHSGCSPVVIQSNRRSSSASVVSSHFRKPWAMTTSETSHNVVYNDDLGSYRRRRASIQVPRPTRTGCASAPNGKRQRSKSLALSRPFTAFRHRQSPGSDQLEGGDTSVRTLVSDMENADEGQVSSESQLFPTGSFQDISKRTPADTIKIKKLAWNEENGHLMKKNFDSFENNHQDINVYHNVEEQNCSTSEDAQNTPETTHTFRDEYVYNNEVLLFKGKQIRHYVRPQDRYKRDPFKEVRQEKLIRKLSIENPIFLNGTRDNLSIHTTFSKAARDRALHRLVEENQGELAARRKPAVNNVDLQKRVREFCTS